MGQKEGMPQMLKMRSAQRRQPGRELKIAPEVSALHGRRFGWVLGGEQHVESYNYLSFVNDGKHAHFNRVPVL